MARRRYLIAVDASNPLLWVDRYLATGDVEYRTSGLMAARVRGDAAMAARSEINDKIRERVAEQAALSRRLASTDLAAPGRWAAESVGALEAGGAPASFAALIASSGGATRQAIVCADREGALAALAAGRARSMDEIGAMEPGPQAEAVIVMWRALADYFLALGVSARGWQKYQDALGRALGGDAGNDGLQRFLVDDLSGSFPEGYDLLFGRRPTGVPATEEEVARAAAALSAPELAPPWPQGLLDDLRAGGVTIPPANASSFAVSSVRSAEVAAIYRSASRPRPTSWVDMAAQRVRALYGAEPALVYFGAKAAVEAAGRNVLRLSIGEDGRLVVGAMDSPSNFDRLDCVVRDGRTGRADGSTGGLPAPRPGFNWMCGAVTVDAQNRAYYLAPLLWYALVVRPLLDYLATRDPLEVAHEVMLDVLGKNLWTVIATGRAQQALEGLGAADLIARNAAARASGASAMQRFTSAAGMMAAAASVAAPVVGVVMGAGVGLANLFDALNPPPRVTARGDALGRVEPVVERFQLEPGRVRAFQCGDVGDAAPTGFSPRGRGAPYVPWYGHPVPTAVPVSGRGRLASMLRAPGESPPPLVENEVAAFVLPTLRVRGMRPGWSLYLDGQPAPGGRWQNGSWAVDAPSGGDHELALGPPPGSPEPPRRATVTVPSRGSTTVDFDAVPPVAAPRPPAPPAVPQPTWGSGGAFALAVAAVVAAGAAAGGVALYRRSQAARKRNGRRARARRR